jgi:hypothetical protein
MEDYSKMTTQEFDDILEELVKKNAASLLIAIPGAYEVFSDYFNNEILHVWREQQEEQNIDANYRGHDYR